MDGAKGTARKNTGDYGIACDPYFGVIEDYGASGLTPATSQYPAATSSGGTDVEAPSASGAGNGDGKTSRGDSPAPAPTTPVRIVLEPGVSYREELPTAILKRVDRCAAVAISRRRISGAGCLDTNGTFSWKQPKDAPDLIPDSFTRFILPVWSR